MKWCIEYIRCIRIRMKFKLRIFSTLGTDGCFCQRKRRRGTETSSWSTKESCIGRLCEQTSRLIVNTEWTYIHSTEALVRRTTSTQCMDLCQTNSTGKLASDIKTKSNLFLLFRTRELQLPSFDLTEAQKKSDHVIKWPYSFKWLKQTTSKTLYLYT